MSVVKVMTLYVLSLLLSGLEKVASSREMSVIFLPFQHFEMHRNIAMVAKPTNAHEVYESIL
jgi:hypothetical protein